ncbi:MAG: hypothetical protein ACPL7M_07900 [Bryobacteraceae bacterium]
MERTENAHAEHGLFVQPQHQQVRPCRNRQRPGNGIMVRQPH